MSKDYDILDKYDTKAFKGIETHKYNCLTCHDVGFIDSSFLEDYRSARFSGLIPCNDCNQYFDKIDEEREG